MDQKWTICSSGGPVVVVVDQLIFPPCSGQCLFFQLMQLPLAISATIRVQRLLIADLKTHMHSIHSREKLTSLVASSSFSLIHPTCSQCNQYIVEAAAMRTHMHRMHNAEKLSDQLKN